MIVSLTCLAVSHLRGQVPGERIPALESRPAARDWARVQSAGAAVLAGNYTGSLSNDGRYLIGWSGFKTLEVAEMRTGKTLLFENVFASQVKGSRPVILTDSQIGHVRNKLPFT